MRVLPRFLLPALRLRRLLVLCGAGLMAIGLTVAFVDHPLAYLARLKVASLFAGVPDVALDFRRDPADRPALASGTAETPMAVMDPCVIADAEGYHLFFSSLFCETPKGPSLFWRPELGDEFNILKLPTGIAYAFSADRGRSWEVRPTPLLMPAAGSWDDHRVETASAVVKGGVLHLFYCADSKQRLARYQVG
jgi:hypothetical protein